MVVVPDQCAVMSSKSASDQKTSLSLKYRTNIKGAKLVTVIGIPLRNLGILSFKTQSKIEFLPLYSGGKKCLEKPLQT